MPVAWRLVKESHADKAFDGEGAARFGGRWNSPRVPIVYASATLSLAALETLVHLIQPTSFGYLAFRIEFDERLLERVPISTLLPDWNVEPPGPASMAVGDDWVGQARTAVLAVPSTIVPNESNFLLNPAHPDFGKISIAKPEFFAFDPRLRP